MAEVGNIASLGLQVDGTGAIQTIRTFGSETEKTGKLASGLTASLRTQEAQLRSLAKAQASGVEMNERFIQKIIAMNGGIDKYLQMQRQVQSATTKTVEATATTTAAVDKLDKAKKTATLTSDKFRGGLMALSVQATGLNPTIARLAGTLGQFAVGSGVMVGVLAGLAAVAFAYEKLTSKAQEAKRASDELIASLAKQRQEAINASEAGSAKTVADAQKALADRRKALRDIELTGAPGTADIAGGANFGASRVAVEKRILEAQQAVRQAEIDLAALRADAASQRYNDEVRLQQLKTDGADQLKRIDDEAEARRKKAFDEEERRQRERLQRLNRTNAGGGDVMSGVIANIDRKIALGGMRPQTDDDRAEMERIYAAYERDREQRELRREQMIDAQRRREAESIGKLGRAALTAAQTIGQSLSYLLVNKLGGGGIGGSLGAGLGSTLTKGMSAFGMSAGPLGAILGAGLGNIAGKLVGGLFGPSSADREAARKAAAAQRDLAASMDIMRQKAAGANTTLLEQIEANRKYYESLKQQITDTFKGRKNEAERYRLRDEADRMRAAEDEKIRQDYARTQREKKEDLEVRRLRALGRSEEADAVAVALANERELAEARRNGADAATLATIAEIQKAEAERRAADAAKQAAEESKRAADAANELARREYELAEARRKAERDLQGSLMGRGLAAMGRGRDAEDARMAFSARQEMQDAIAAGMGPSTLAMLAFVQVMEREQLLVQRAIEDQTKAIESAARAQIESIDREIAAIRLISEVESKAIDQQIAAIRNASESAQKGYEQQIDAIKLASDIELKAFDEQIDIARSALDVARDQLREQERAVEETRRVFESLRDFGAGLKLNPSLTTLSPIQQMIEARRQYDTLLASANAGDKTAAGRLPDAARSYLDASRGVNASGPGYVADFMRVQQTLAAVTDKFGVQLTIEERILKELEGQTVSLEAQLTALQVAKDQAQSNASAQIAELQRAKEQAAESASAQIETLQAAKDQAAERASAQIAELERIKDQTRADADRAIAQMIEQLNAALEAKAQSIAYYEEWKRTTDRSMADNVRYFAEMIEKLGRIIEETFRTAENTKTLTERAGWEELFGPIGELPSQMRSMTAKQDETNTELKAAVNTLYNGFVMMEGKQNAIWEAINGNTSVTRQGLEGARL